MATATEIPPPPHPLSPAKMKRWDLLKTYEAKTTTALSALALVYLFTFTAQAIWYYPQQAWFQYMQLFGYLLWLLFAIDLLFRFIVDPVKKSFFKYNALDTITVVIPQLRALRALRAFTSNGILSQSKTGSILTSGGITSGILGVLLIVWVGGLMVLNAERGAPGAEIDTFSDAIWWGFETITTVGYGDFVPVTELGRFLAVLIMFVGIGVLSTVTAAVAASLARNKAAQPDPSQEVMAELGELKQMVASLQAKLDAKS